MGRGPWTETVDGLYVPLSFLNFWASLGKWAFEGMETRAQLVSQEALLQINCEHRHYSRQIGLPSF